MHPLFSPLARALGVWLALSLASLGAIEAAPQPATAVNTAVWIGRSAPDFLLHPASGSAQPLKVFRGKWVFLEFGQLRCQPSERVAARLVHLQQALSAQPFVFIHAYGAGSLDDVRLVSTAPPGGVLARYDELPAFYEFDSVPTWLLLDPEGIVRAAGQYLDWPQAVATLRAHLPFGREILDHLDPPPEESGDVQRAAQLSADHRYPEAEILWRKLYEADPGNPLVIAELARSTAWVKGYKAANLFLSSALKRWPSAADVPGFLRRQQFDYLHTEDSAARRALLPALLRDFPQSRFLQAQRLKGDKAPRELTKEDILFLAEAHELEPGCRLLVLAAYGAEALGMSEPAARLWSEVHPSNRDDRLALVRFWQAAAAQEIVKKEVGAVTLAESNKVRLWDAMLFYAAAADWEKADQFAGQYLAVRPEFALGRLVRLWIALRRGQPEEARKWSEELAAFPTANAEYALCRAMQNSGQWDLGRLARIGSDKEKNDALLWAVLVPLAQGQRAEALAHIRSAEKNLDHGSWAFSFLWSVEGWLEAPASPGPAQAQQ